MKNLEFGYKCRDIITGFEGILKTRIVHITGCDRVELVGGNKEEDKQYIDVPVLKIIDEGVYSELKDLECNKYNDVDEALYDFGVLAKDKLTGFEGVIVAKSIGISGDISYGLSPKFEKSSKNNDAIWFDEGRIEIIENKKEEINTNTKRTGGAVPNYKIR